MTVQLTRTAAALLALGLLVACGKKAAAPPPPTVAVTTAKPQQRSFTDSIEAYGVAQGDPRHARSVSLAQAGQVVAINALAGQSVHAGETLLKLATDPLARTAFLQAQSALTLARSELDRVTRLAAQHLATQSQLATARKALADAEVALAAQRQLGGAAAIQPVTAPADGVITAVQVALGDRVPANAPLLTFAPTSALIAQLGVQPDQAAQLKSGMPVTLRAVYGKLDPAEGRVSMLGRAVDPQSHLVPVQVSVPSVMAAQMVAGAAIDAQIHTANYTAWAVPRASVLSDEQGHYLFQLDHGKAHRVDVKVRSPAGDTIGVDGPINASLPVIVMGAYELSDGMSVREQAQ